MAILRKFLFPPERGYMYVDENRIIEIYYRRIGEHYVLHRSILIAPNSENTDPWINVSRRAPRFHRCPETIDVVDGGIDEETVDRRCLEILESMPDVDTTGLHDDTKV